MWDQPPSDVLIGIAFEKICCLYRPGEEMVSRRQTFAGTYLFNLEGVLSENYRLIHQTAGSILTQVNTLEQLANVASYNFLKRRLESHQLHVHALWFDIYTGDIYYFSRQNKKFVEINEFTVDSLSDEVRRYYS